MKSENQKYCTECGALINIKAEICPSCGVRQTFVETINLDSESQNRWLLTLLMCWFLGVWGVHRFYTGHIAIGVIQLLTFGGCGIWYLVDLILIIIGSYKDSNGNRIKYK